LGAPQFLRDARAEIMSVMQQHVVPTILWGSGGSAVREEKSWCLTTYHQDVSTGSSVRITTGNKIYTLSASRMGEFDSSKKVSTNDASLFKKYRQVFFFLSSRSLSLSLSLSRSFEKAQTSFLDFFAAGSTLSTATLCPSAASTAPKPTGPKRGS